MINHTEILFTIAETKVLTLHLYANIIVDSWQSGAVYLEKIWKKNAKCVKYCADKYEFFRALHDGGEKGKKSE